MRISSTSQGCLGKLQDRLDGFYATTWFTFSLDPFNGADGQVGIRESHARVGPVPGKQSHDLGIT